VAAKKPAAGAPAKASTITPAEKAQLEVKRTRDRFQKVEARMNHEIDVGAATEPSGWPLRDGVNTQIVDNLLRAPRSSPCRCAPPKSRRRWLPATARQRCAC
jgi:hypothetical protein